MHDLIARLALLDACAVSDALDSLGHAGAVEGLVRRATRERIAGRVRTLKLAGGPGSTGAASHLGTRSVEEATDTDVIVVEQRSGVIAASWGGVLANAARHKHVCGVIVEGPVRDIDEIAEVGLPVFSRSITTRTARGRIHEAGINVPIIVGDVPVNPGDLVIADGSGVVFVAADIAAQVIARAERIVAREKLLVDAVNAGDAPSAVMGREYETMLSTPK